MKDTRRDICLTLLEKTDPLADYCIKCGFSNLESFDPTQEVLEPSEAEPIEWVSCDDCSRWFHLQCLPTATTLSQMRNTSFQCEPCLQLAYRRIRMFSGDSFPTGASSSAPPKTVDKERKPLNTHCQKFANQPRKPWHNEKENFVLLRRPPRVRKCKGCKSNFGGKTSLVVRHKECNPFWNKSKNEESMSYGNAYYHPSIGCIRPRHHYFLPSEMVIHPDANPTIKEIHQLKKAGLDISNSLV